MALQPRPHLLTLPPEVRESVYRLILHPDANRLFEPDEYTDYGYSDAFVLFKLNRQIYTEARKVFRDLNVFVRIETPWPQAESHVALEGHTPILMKADRAARFTEYSMNVVIDPAETSLHNAVTECFVIHLADLDKFTTSWFYADLSNMGLNGLLRLSLHLRDPYTPDWDEKRMPKWLQRSLLLPFGMVKGLSDTIVTGSPPPYPSIVAELREQQAVPHKSAEQCLRESTALKLQGNDQLSKGNFHAALQKYNEAWEAMHVVIKGRQRHIHADAFFGRYLTESPYRGKHGQSERLILRVQLVANTILTYLKLRDWHEAIFWGMRSITMLREAVGADDHNDMDPNDEAVVGFPAADQMGKIYYRTALAYKELGDKAEARRLLRVSIVYLPRDERVRQEYSDCALKLG